jgi:hypothetical protein
MMRDLKPGELVAVMDYGNVWRVVEKRPGDTVRVRCLAHVTTGIGFAVGTLTSFDREACCPALPRIYERMARPPVDVRGLQ